MPTVTMRNDLWYDWLEEDKVEDQAAAIQLDFSGQRSPETTLPLVCQVVQAPQGSFDRAMLQCMSAKLLKWASGPITLSFNGAQLAQMADKLIAGLLQCAFNTAKWAGEVTQRQESRAPGNRKHRRQDGGPLRRVHRMYVLPVVDSSQEDLQFYASNSGGSSSDKEPAPRPAAHPARRLNANHQDIPEAELPSEIRQDSQGSHIM